VSRESSCKLPIANNNISLFDEMVNPLAFIIQHKMLIITAIALASVVAYTLPVVDLLNSAEARRGGGGGGDDDCQPDGSCYKHVKPPKPPK
jgi:hypothetical protein